MQSLPCNFNNLIERLSRSHSGDYTPQMSLNGGLDYGTFEPNRINMPKRMMYLISVSAKLDRELFGSCCSAFCYGACLRSNLAGHQSRLGSNLAGYQSSLRGDLSSHQSRLCSNLSGHYSGLHGLRGY